MRFIGDDISLYTQGDLFLIGASLPHTFVSYHDGAMPQVEAFCIQFPKSIFDSFAECKPLSAFFQEAKRGIAFPKPNDLVVEKIREIVLATGTLALMRLIELLDQLRQTQAYVPVLRQDYQRQAMLADASTRIRTAIDYINVHYQRTISLQEIAGKCHFSPNAFCRWFRQHMGLTFVDYLTKVSPICANY